MATPFQSQVPGRFTSRTGHDRCYQGVASALTAAEAPPAISAVTVIRRDGQAVLRQEHPAVPGRASWAWVMSVPFG